MPEAFECKKCGHCCEGRGGIILSGKDMARLADFLGLSPEEVDKKFCEKVNGKLRLITGQDGFCVFFKTGMGCAVHAGKPDICRAWPFFRGNLEDPASLAMAREFCPGINKYMSFADFARSGLDYLKSQGLIARDGRKEACALVLGDLKDL